MATKFNFDDFTEESPFSYKGTQYAVRVASAGAIATYNNARGNKTTYGPDGQVVSVKDGGELKCLLVSLCLFTADDSKLVPLPSIKTWPEPMVDKLFDEAKRLAGIDQPASIEFIEEKIELLQQLREKLLAEKSEESQKNS